MPASTFVFYCGNVILLTAYVVLARLAARPGGVTGIQQYGPLLKWAGVVFFVLAAVLHLDMAVHTLTRVPFFVHGGNRVTWDFALIVFAKMVSVAVALVGVHRESRRRHHDSRGP